MSHVQAFVPEFGACPERAILEAIDAAGCEGGCDGGCEACGERCDGDRCRMRAWPDDGSAPYRR
ncbi:hypothetical protein FKV24_017830 [Lysobacter maris]|uniref:Uncharacterized protein n=1 Tax=Marilutibacter maris TaxID=1605891 RepID=A0A507ZYW8_9GAMM|nr:hypothetical protein [Lysobacter maris]KAB8163592.1 hypothetical protein FKV24_017830 [Lysobacter maris]